MDHTATSQAASPAALVTTLQLSETKRAANRNNAKKSTGPKTGRGKAHSSQNARKHGFYAKNLFVDPEERAEYEEILNELIESENPSTTRERMLVEQMARDHFRLRQAFRYENRKRVRIEDTEAQLSVADEMLKKVLTDPEKALARIVSAKSVFQLCLDELDDIPEKVPYGPVFANGFQNKILARNRLQDSSLQLIRDISLCLYKELVLLNGPHNKPVWEAAWVDERNRAQMKNTVEVALAEFGELEAKAHIVLLHPELKEEQERIYMPDVDTLRQILPYENMITRSQVTCFDQLERLRAIRADDLDDRD